MTRFAARLNSFAACAHAASPQFKGKPTPMMLAQRAAGVPGLTHVDLNFPDHVDDDIGTVKRKVNDMGLKVNGLAMRYYSNPAFRLGAFTNPDPVVRREAIDLTRRGIDAALEMGAPLMTIWLGQDGFDYSFQADYSRIWQDEVDGIREVAGHAPECMVLSNTSPTSRVPMHCFPTWPRHCWPSTKPDATISESRLILPMSFMPTRCRPLRPPMSPGAPVCWASTSTMVTARGTMA
ncbi:MAG: TIM barrel protein [Geminicoccaceae bacterium]|nr:TIM barrel protein [Geminicoccaceae bacterium]